MKKEEQFPDFTTLCEIAKLFASCMNDYLYVMDLTNDIYFITENALERFALPVNTFGDTRNIFRSLVHAEDIDMLLADLDEIVSGSEKALERLRSALN